VADFRTAVLIGVALPEYMAAPDQKPEITDPLITREPSKHCASLIAQASGSSSEISSALRSATATASCAGVKVVYSR
jgi:hypothetical protein